jgi:hypothetical protein
VRLWPGVRPRRPGAAQPGGGQRRAAAGHRAFTVAVACWTEEKKGLVTVHPGRRHDQTLRFAAGGSETVPRSQ